MPTAFGEKAVLRVFDPDILLKGLDELGLSPHDAPKFHEFISRPTGIILVTGPTGSGKTTTLYSALHQLNQVSENIMTAEDPVEYSLPGINQVQMHDEIGLNFAAALRSFLRQDPDIIMVGEIRDYETAEIGVKAALTGHLVLSTLHTNDAPSTINRLLNMGVEPFLVSSSVILILAQRLLRRICSGCKEPVEVNPQALIEIGFSPEEAETMTVMHGKGCQICSGTGYKGRVALYEVMTITDRIRDLILQGASTGDIKAAAVENGMSTLRRSGLEKVKQGQTTIEEVIRVTFAD
jgi:type IV pilus assembly protein PilB